MGNTVLLFPGPPIVQGRPLSDGPIIKFVYSFKNTIYQSKLTFYRNICC